MSFLDLAEDVRLQVYMQLLVLAEPIVIYRVHEPEKPPILRAKDCDLHPAILRVCKLIYDEALPLFYSQNHFSFTLAAWTHPSLTSNNYVALFIRQIGVAAKHIRRMQMPFPEFAYTVPQSADLDEAYVADLKLIGDKTAVQTIELSIPSEHNNYALDDWPVSPHARNILDRHLKMLPSIKEIVIIIEKYPNWGGDDEELMAEMRSVVWIVKVTMLPKRIWISYDDRCEFDNKDDCRVYDTAQLQWEHQLEEQREAEEWTEEYYRRRNDPYWKNDSDYD